MRSYHAGFGCPAVNLRHVGEANNRCFGPIGISVSAVAKSGSRNRCTSGRISFSTCLNSSRTFGVSLTAAMSGSVGWSTPARVSGHSSQCERKRSRSSAGRSPRSARSIWSRDSSSGDTGIGPTGQSPRSHGARGLNTADAPTRMNSTHQSDNKCGGIWIPSVPGRGGGVRHLSFPNRQDATHTWNPPSKISRGDPRTRGGGGPISELYLHRPRLPSSPVQPRPQLFDGHPPSWRETPARWFPQSPAG